MFDEGVNRSARTDFDSLVVTEEEPMARPLFTDEFWELIEPCLI